MTRYKPVGWRNESQRHSLARKGIKTVSKVPSYRVVGAKGSDFSEYTEEERELYVGKCQECGKQSYMERDIQLCDECVNKFDMDKLWKLHDEGKLDALDFNESEEMREKFRMIGAKGDAGFKDKKVLTEREVLLAKRRLNDGKITTKDVFGESYEEKRLIPEQERKGYEWLMDKWKTPKGAERKNNPYGYREQAVLEDFSHIMLYDFTDIAPCGAIQYGIKNYVPVYRVISKNGSSFEYYVRNGEPYIVG